MREIRLSGSVEGVMGNHDLYSDLSHVCYFRLLLLVNCRWLIAFICSKRLNSYSLV